jgi:hypothetical protein
MRRRLIQFWRWQKGTTIEANVKVISQEEYDQVSGQGIVTLSCIFNPHDHRTYVTSVDVIYLLESLVASQFSVEEKNRIRRNLEGFKPITVSKTKGVTEEFFRIIMGFPQPRPRNIEKDIKVFSWDSLAPALYKIIGKYVSQAGLLA